MTTATLGKWVKKWTVPGSGDKPWTVSLSELGVYGCSCPRWKFRREECHHILQVKAGLGTEANGAPKPRPEYVLAHVCEPTLKGDQLLIPLVVPGDAHMGATICYAMLKNGFSWGEIKERRQYSIHPSWTAKAVMAYIEEHGQAWRECCRKYPHEKD
jgi:hypothetical protein